MDKKDPIHFVPNRKETTKMKKILIISAMADVELNHLIENLQEKQIIESKICKF